MAMLNDQMVLCTFVVILLSTWRLEGQQTNQTSTVGFCHTHLSFFCSSFVRCLIPCSRQSLEPDSGYVMGLLRGIKDRRSQKPLLIIIRVTWPSWPSWDLFLIFRSKATAGPFFPRRSWTRRAPSWTWRKRRSERPTAASSRPRRTVTVGLNLGGHLLDAGGCHHAITLKIRRS